MQRTARIVTLLVLTGFFVHAPLFTPASVSARLQDFAELVPIYDTEGESIGQLSAYGIYDQFDIVEPGNELEQGTHHVLIEVGFFNTGTEPLPYDPDGFLIIDTNGFAYSRVMINNVAAEDSNLYLGQAGTVELGSDFYGRNAYIVPDGAVIERIIYSTAGNHISVYDMRTTENPAGTAVYLNDQAGLPMGQVGVNTITDPFEAHDPASPPAVGTRYVAVDVMVANQGQQPVSVVASDFRAIDELGRLVKPATVTSTDPALVLLAEGDVQPGGTAQGIVVFQLPEAGSIAQVTFANGGVRDQVIADLEVTASTSDSTGGCAGFVNWALDTLGGLGSVSVFPQNLQGANPEALDAGMLSIYYQQSASTLETLGQVVPPPAVAEVHTYLIETYLVPMTNALETLMNAVAAGDYATAQGALDEMTAIQTPFNPGGEGQARIAELETLCPEEYEELMTMGS